MGGFPFPYIIPIVPRSLPAEVVEGEHFVLADRLKLVPGSSSQLTPAQEDQTGAATRTLVRSARVRQPQSPRATPRLAKKRETRAQYTKAAGAELEDFLNWIGVADIEPVEEEDMFSLITGFAAGKRKQSVTLEGADTSSSR